MTLTKVILIWCFLVYGVYYLYTREPPKMARKCIASHTKTTAVMIYNAALKMSIPIQQERAICDTYSDWYVNPKWQRWADKQGEPTR